MIKKPIIQKIVLAGLIFNKTGNVLILQRHANEDIYPNMWELPSGKREPLEPSNDSLLREIKEETGLIVKVVQPSSVFEYQIEKPDEIRDSTQINFIVKTKSSKVKLSEEHQDYAWISKGDLDKYEMSAETKQVIADAFNLYNKLS